MNEAPITPTSGPLRGPLRKRESNLWERAPHDWYIEPEWCSARLFKAERFEGGVLDPACGLGRIVTSAWAAGLAAEGTDLAQHADGFPRGLDFLSDEYPAERFHFANIVSNPPFRHAEKFVQRALQVAPRKVAMLLPANWVQGQKRSRWLATTPLYRVYFICPRPSMPPGAVIAAGSKPGNGTTDYAWFVWLQGFAGAPTIHWLYRDGAAA